MPIIYKSRYEGSDLVGSINKLTKYFRLPGQMFDGEMHLPQMNYCGPGTRLDLRLNENNTWKEWSKPVDRVDLAAYHHDMEYAKHSDTPNRNIADEAMVRELDSIENPTLRERAERAIVKPIIAAKAKFGLGVEINIHPHNGFIESDFRDVASKKNPP